jgi:hypothetical protein
LRPARGAHTIAPEKMMGRSVMAEDYWRQTATLFRKAGGIAIEPDPPIWVDAGVVAEGTLSEILKRFAELPRSHQPHHVVQIANGEVSGETLKGLLKDPRYSD